MSSYHRRQKDSAVTIRVVCAVLFCAFSFCWQYFFQADAMALLFHVITKGQFPYHDAIGAVGLTLMLLLLAQLIGKLVHIPKYTQALRFLPSMLLLGILSDVDEQLVDGFSFGQWLWIAPVVLVVWLIIVWATRQMFSLYSSRRPIGFFSRSMWVNVLQMGLMMMAVAAVGNTDAVFHYRLKAERALMDGDMEKALSVGKRSHEADEHLTMLRARALYNKGEMGERLFEYPVKGRGADLLPGEGSRSRLLILSPDSFHISNKADYQLCSLLVDRKVDEFARLLSQHYTIDESLPRHYREALILYSHKWRNPVVEYHETVMDEDWRNLQQLERENKLASERQLQVFDKYEGTYWYYFTYGN